MRMRARFALRPAKRPAPARALSARGFADPANRLTAGFVPGEIGLAEAGRVDRVEQVERRHRLAALDRGAERRGDGGEALAHVAAAGEADLLDAGPERAQRGAGLVAAIEHGGGGRAGMVAQRGLDQRLEP